jgi:hypothetical protein
VTVLNQLQKNTMRGQIGYTSATERTKKWLGHLGCDVIASLLSMI